VTDDVNNTSAQDQKPQLNAVDFVLDCEGKFSPRALRKWLKCVNWYSAAKRHPTQWQTKKRKFLRKFIVPDNMCNVFII